MPNPILEYICVYCRLSITADSFESNNTIWAGFNMKIERDFVWEANIEFSIMSRCVELALCRFVHVNTSKVVRFHCIISEDLIFEFRFESDECQNLLRGICSILMFWFGLFRPILGGEVKFFHMFFRRKVNRYFAVNFMNIVLYVSIKTRAFTYQIYEKIIDIIIKWNYFHLKLLKPGRNFNEG